MSPAPQAESVISMLRNAMTYTERVDVDIGPLGMAIEGVSAGMQKSTVCAEPFPEDFPEDFVPTCDARGCDPLWQ